MPDDGPTDQFDACTGLDGWTDERVRFDSQLGSPTQADRMDHDSMGEVMHRSIEVSTTTSRESTITTADGSQLSEVSRELAAELPGH